jgi:hypothetical protein
VWLVIVVVGVLSIRAIGAGQSTSSEIDNTAAAAAPASCLALVEGDIVESQEYTPWQNMRLPPETPILSSRGIAPLPHRWIPTNILDGLPLQYALGGQIETRFFFDRPLDPSMTLSEFIAEGGISFVQDPANPEATAERLLASYGGRGVAVDVGEYAGVLVWADPRPTGIRHHELWWSDGVFAYKLLADRSAVAITNIARSMVCGST